MCRDNEGDDEEAETELDKRFIRSVSTTRKMMMSRWLNEQVVKQHMDMVVRDDPNVEYCA